MRRLTAALLAAVAIATVTGATTGTATAKDQEPGGGCTLVWDPVEVAPGVTVWLPGHMVC